MKYAECWTVVRVVVEDGEGGRDEGFAAARLARGGQYGPRWQVTGWLQEEPTDYDSAVEHGLSVGGRAAFAEGLFPARFHRPWAGGRGKTPRE